MSKTATINLQAEPGQQALLTRAAALRHQDRDAFILEVACREAEQVLLDQCLFRLNQNDFEAFETALDIAMLENAKLKTLLSEPSPWENKTSSFTD